MDNRHTSRSSQSTSPAGGQRRWNPIFDNRSRSVRRVRRPHLPLSTPLCNISAAAQQNIHQENYGLFHGGLKTGAENYTVRTKLGRIQNKKVCRYTRSLSAAVVR